jgi:branched-chain amino acid transport system permease protein
VDTFVALAFSAAAYGAVLALAALGFLVLYKATGVVNFAHGDLITLGGYVALWFLVDVGMNTVLGYLAAVAVMFAIGALLERLAYAPLRRRPHLTVLIATLAAALVIRAAISLWQGSTPQRLPSPVDDSVADVFGASISGQRILIIAVSAVCIGAVVWLFGNTSFGRQLRALASDRETAELYAIRTGRISVVAWGMSAALAALAGILVAPLSSLDLNFGFSIMLAAFAAAVLGGFGNLWGVVLGSMTIGAIQYLLGGYIFQDYAVILPYIAMLAVLALRPQGLLGRSEVRL